MGTVRRVIAGHGEGQTIFRISTYPVLRGKNLAGTYAGSHVSVRHVFLEVKRFRKR